MTTKIDSFSGENHFLSNFWPCQGTKCKHTAACKHALEIEYQAAKALNDEDRAVMLAAPDAGASKKMGKKVALRPDWEDVKVGVMRDLLHKKFNDPLLRSKLLATGDAELVEGNWWGDTFWGVCRGKGQNWLGRLLMELRAQLAFECQNTSQASVSNRRKLPMPVGSKKVKM